MGTPESGIWTTQDGRDIHVTEMTTSHLKNLIRAIREGRVFPPLLVLPTAEGDVVDSWTNKRRAKWLELLTQELSKRRGLEHEES
jgi:hypothetical protein